MTNDYSCNIYHLQEGERRRGAAPGIQANDKQWHDPGSAMAARQWLMGLKVKLPMILEMDNKEAIDLANNWSIGGRTRHVDVRHCFLRELKKSKVMDICWIKGSENDADAFTKHFDGPVFEKCIRTLVGQDVHMKSYTSEQGGCQEGSQGTQKGVPDFN